MTKFILTTVVPVARMSGRLGNLSSWLNEAINEDIQIVIVHDAQDSATGIELKQIVDATFSKNIVLVEKKFNSPGLARNYGLERALGDWITFWDSDDLPHPQKYLSMIKNAEATKKNVAIGKFQTINLNNEILFKEPNTFELNSIFLNPGFWRMTFKSELLKDQKFPKYRMAEDQLFLAKLNIEANQVYFEDEIIYTYVVGSDTQLTRNSEARIELAEVIKLMQTNIQKKEIHANFSKLLYFKLCITQLKVSKISHQIWAARNLIAFISKPKNFILIVSTLFRKWRNAH